MKCKLYFIAILFLAFPAEAREDYLQYHRSIILCEQQFLFKDNIRAALAGYKAVFDQYRKPFAKDCFIALQLACCTSDTAITSYFFRKAFERGITWTAVEVSDVILEFLDRRPKYKEEVLSMYQPCRAKWQSGIDTNLRTLIKKMARKDDSSKWKMDFLDPGSAELYKRAENYIAVVDSNTAQLIRLSHRYGFPGDNKIGFLDDGNTSGALDAAKAHKRYCYSLYSIVDQLFFHQYCCYFSLKPELEKALEDGEISPAMYAVIYEWAYHSALIPPQFRRGHPPTNVCNASPTGKTKTYCICPVLLPTIEDKYIPFVDSCRAEIGLASMAHYKKKKEYEKARGLKLFFGSFDRY